MLLLLLVGGWFNAGRLQAAPVQVAVLDFKAENATNGNDDWTVGLADFVELALQKEGVETLERRQIRLVLGERELQSGGLVSAAGLRKRGLPAVNYFVSGSVRRVAGNKFTLTVSLHRADNATVENTLTRRGAYPAEWLAAIDSVAKEAGDKLRAPAKLAPTRSEFESLTWFPEAALPFFKGLEYYSRGDLPQAAGWFRTASGKDPRFDQARLWEARALLQFGFPELANFAVGAARKGAGLGRTNAAKLPVVAVIAPEGVPIAGRAAFVNALARSGRFEMFEPQAIGATAREIDLQLTGQMAAPLTGRSVWLVVDSMVFLEMANAELRARQSDLLSGQLLRQVSTPTDEAGERSFVQLAEAFLNVTAKEEAKPVAGGAEEMFGEPNAGDRPEVVFGKVLRLAKAHPDRARPWIGLADFYGEWTPRMLLLDRAIATIERDPKQEEASFWLTSALWRKRSMVRRAWFYPDSSGYQENPLTNDFALLLKMFPQSTEAQTLDEWTHKAGIYTYSHPKGKDTRYLIGAAYGSVGPHASPDPSASVGNGKSPAVVGEAEWLARLKRNRELGNYAKAWMQANWGVPPLSQAVRTEVERINADLLKIAVRENEAFKAFTTTIDRGEKTRALELGQELLNCLFRTQRLAVIEKCGALVKATRGCEAQVAFLIAQMERYKEDFNFDPATGAPRTETVDFRFDPGTDRPGSWSNLSPDLSVARVLGQLVESDTACGNLELTAGVYEALRNNEALPLRNRLTAMFDLARLQYDQGRAFEAVELLQELLQQTDGNDLPQARGESWGSSGVESAAFELLKKIRLFADPEVNFADCCGELPNPPLPKPDNLEEMNRWFAELWVNIRGGVGATNRPIKELLIERRAEALPALLYNLQQHQDLHRSIMFAGFLGTNAVAALPFVTHYVCGSEPYPYVIYGTALAALAGIGKPAACAMPVLILASEGSGYLFNVKAALKQVGPAPRRSMPHLARLLYHKSQAVEVKAARAMIETAALPAATYAGQTEEQLIVSLRTWWEQEGSHQDWADH